MFWLSYNIITGMQKTRKKTHTEYDIPQLADQRYLWSVWQKSDDFTITNTLSVIARHAGIFARLNGTAVENVLQFPCVSDCILVSWKMD